MLSSIAEIPMPMRMSRVPATPPLNASEYTSRATPSPAAMARTETCTSPRDRVTMAMAAAALAELMPSDVGAGERVAEHRLEGDAGQAEAESGDEGEDRAAAAAAARR